MAIPIIGGRKARKQADVDAAFQKAVTAAVAQAAMQSQMSSGATYPVGINGSSPFNQVGPGAGYQPLPRPPGTFDSGFGPANPLFPDAIDPLGPNGRTVPRRGQYLIAANLQLVDRRVPWSVLRGLAEEVDIVARCIQIVQDALVGLNWSWGFSQSILNQIMADQGITNSAKANSYARDKYGDELQRVTEFFEYPDRRMEQTFSEWLTSLLFSHLVYDGIAVAPTYNLGGELTALSVIDTPTIKILLDNQGFLPQPPAPAYQQILYGFPRGEYQAEGMDQDGNIPGGIQDDQLFYRIRRPRADSVYGFSQVEECLNIATIYMQRQQWLHSEYSHGVTPKLYIETEGTENWTPEQLAYYESTINSQWSGQTERRQQIMLGRPGMKPTQLKGIDEVYGSAYDEFLILQIGAKFGIPQSQLGIQMRSSIGGGQAKGQTDQTQMFATDALKEFLIDCINDMARRFLGVGPELTMTATGGGTEDDNVQRAQADASDVGAGIRTRNEIRAERGVPLIPEPEADQLGVTSPTGVTFLSGLLDAEESSQQITQNMASSGQVPGQPKPEAAGESDPNAEAEDQAKPPAAASTPKPSSDDSNANSNVTPKDDSRQPDAENETAKELAAFSKWAKTRMGKSAREFEFTTVDPVRAAALNDAVRSGDDAAVKEQLSLAKRDDDYDVVKAMFSDEDWRAAIAEAMACPCSPPPSS